MGYIKHHAIVVTSSNTIALATAHERAAYAGCRVTPITAKGVNSYASFLVAPDGSKEGWSESTEGDGTRDAFVRWLRGGVPADAKLAAMIEWVEVAYGSDDENASVTRHAWNEAPDPAGPYR